MTQSIRLPAFFSAITPPYLAQRQAEFEHFERLLTQGALDDIAARFHQISGSGGSFGLPELSTRAKAVERAAGTGDVVAVRETLSDYLDHVAAIALEFED